MAMGYLLDNGLGLLVLVVLDDFLDDEGQELLRELRVEIGLLGQLDKTGDLLPLPRRVRRGEPMGGLEPAHGLRVLEPLGEREDQDRVEPVDRLPVLPEELGG